MNTVTPGTVKEDSMDKDIAEDLQENNVIAETDSLDNVEETPPEKMLPASKVNELIKKAKHKGEQKMQEQLEQAQKIIEQLQSSQQASLQIDLEKLQSQILEKIEGKLRSEKEQLEQQQLQREVDQIAQQYYGKMAQGKELYDDFEAVTADFDPSAFPQIVFLANQVDNTPEVIYELSKKPGKLAELQKLLEHSPQLARKQMINLSQSIKNNREAKNNLVEPQEPLDRMKPSPIAGTDNGVKTVRDYKNMPFLKV